jgi:hypothetical protein
MWEESGFQPVRRTKMQQRLQEGDKGNANLGTHSAVGYAVAMSWREGWMALAKLP